MITKLKSKSRFFYRSVSLQLWRVWLGRFILHYSEQPARRKLCTWDRNFLMLYYGHGRILSGRGFLLVVAIATEMFALPLYVVIAMGY